MALKMSWASKEGDKGIVQSVNGYSQTVEHDSWCEFGPRSEELGESYKTFDLPITIKSSEFGRLEEILAIAFALCNLVPQSLLKQTLNEIVLLAISNWIPSFSTSSYLTNTGFAPVIRQPVELPTPSATDY